MVFYSILPFTCMVAAFLLCLFVFLKNPNSPINRSFSLLCFETFSWQLCWFLTYYIEVNTYGTLLVKMGFTGIIFLPFTHYHFVINFLKLDKKLAIVRLFYFIGGLALIFLWTTDKFMSGYQQFSWGIYGKAGKYYFIYLIFSITAIIQTWLFLRKATKNLQCTASERNQIKFVFFATSLYFLAAPEYLINYGINIYPIGSFFILASYAVIAYTIIKYHLMNITLAAKELLVFVSYLLIVSTVFFSLILLGQNSVVALGLITVAVVSVSPFAYKYITSSVEPTIIRKAFPKLQYLNEQKRFWQDVNRTPYTSGEVSWTLVQGEAEIMQISKVSFLMWSKKYNGFVARSQIGLDEIMGKWLAPLLVISKNDPFIEVLSKKKNPILKEELVHSTEGKNKDIIETMEKLYAEISIPLFEGHKLIGILNLDKKPSGEMFHQDDIKWLKKLAIAAEVHLAHTLFMENRASFSMGIAHDMKNLLRELGLLVGELMEEKCSEKELEEKLKEFALQIGFMGELQEARYNIDEILSRVLSDEYQYETLDLAEIVNEIYMVMKSMAASKNLYLNLSMEQAVPLVIGNKKDIRRLICNLLDNALKFTKEGGVTIVLKKEEEKVLMKISDTGPGIPENKIEEVFEPFIQLNSEDKEKGVGLGLALVKQIVEANKGHIWVKSAIKQGSDFFVTLPVAPEQDI